MESEFIELQRSLDEIRRFAIAQKGDYLRLKTAPQIFAFIEDDKQAFDHDFDILQYLRENSGRDEASFQHQIVQNGIQRIEVTLDLLRAQRSMSRVMGHYAPLYHADSQIDSNVISALFNESTQALKAARKTDCADLDQDRNLATMIEDLMIQYAEDPLLVTDAELGAEENLQRIFIHRLNYLALNLERAHIWSSRVYTCNYEAASVHYCIDAGRLQRDAEVERYLNDRMGISEKLLPEIFDSLEKSATFKEELERMGRDNFTREPFRADEYRSIPLNTLEKNIS